jgi:hypothetical protein
MSQEKYRRFIPLVLLAVILILPASLQAAKIDLSEKAVNIRDEINLDNMKRDIARLSAIRTRVTGYDTAESASKYIFDRFQELGLKDVDSRAFTVTVPIDHGDGTLKVFENGKLLREIRIYTIWPNLVRLSFVPDGLKYTVQEEEDLDQIAREFGVPIERIVGDPRNSFLAKQASDNRDNDGDGQVDEEGEVAVVPGNKIFIPTGGLEGRIFYCGKGDLRDFNDKDIGGFWYEVKPGDTISKVAHKFRVTVSSIADDVLNVHLQRSDDGIDNDGDGIIDEEDEMAPLSDVAKWANDGSDNDGDGIVDEIPGDEKDGIDNDKDGEVDEPGEFVEASESAIFIPKGGIALVDFNSSTRWINAAMLGASAVIFIEPEVTIRGEAETKFLTVPANIPRFWISKEDAQYLLGLLGPDGGATRRIEAQITATVTWENKTGQNIRGILEGSDPELKDELIIIQAYYDSMSVVPYLAPGADTTSGIAALLELARVLSKDEYRPGRSVMFLATGGHFQGLAGMRAFMEGISRDVPGDMWQMRRDIYEELREFQELGRKIALSLDRRLLVDLPPSFFQSVNELTADMNSLAAALRDLSSVQGEINWLVNAKRNEIERRKEKRESTRKREKQEFTPEEQARLETALSKFRKDGLQTAHFFKDVVERLDQLKAQALAECRRAEKQIIEEVALPMAQLDVEAIEKLIEDVKSGKITQYNRYRYIYSEDDIRKMGLKLEDWEISKMARQYSYEKLLDRHLAPSELIRIKKARQTLASAEKGRDYGKEERELLQKAYEAAKSSNPKFNIQKIQQIASAPPKKRFSRDDLRVLRNYLGDEEFTILISTKNSLVKGEGSEERLIGELGRLLKIAERNAELELPRLQLLAKNANNINREFTDEEKRALKHYLSEEDYSNVIAAHAQLFSEYEENRLLNLVRSRARNDIVEIQNLYNQIDSLVFFTDEQKQLLRDNLLTLRNSRIRNIQKKVEIFSRMNKEEYENKVTAMLQAIELQYTMNRYYTSLFISLDLSTQTDQFGVFCKGWFYDQQPEFVLRREFASIGNKLANYANDADFAVRVNKLWQFTDDEIRLAVLSSQWGIASSYVSKRKIEGKTLETLVEDYYDTLVSLGGVSRLMKLEFENMKNRGEPSESMLKDMEYIRKEVERFIRNDIRSARRSRKAQMRLFAKLDQMLALRGINPKELTEDEVADIQTLINIAGLGGSSNFVNAISATGGKTWRTYIPGKIAFDSEVATLAGKTGIAFATVDDARVLSDTPLDTIGRVNFDNLHSQVKTLASILVQALKDPEMPTAARVGNYYCVLFGDVVEFDARESSIPEKPVPYPILAIRRRHKSMMGVRGDLYTTGDLKGDFEISGLAMEGRATYRPSGVQEIEAYKLDPDSGDIVYAPDLGSYGAKIFSNKVRINTRRRGSRVVVFPCVSTTIYDLVDPRYLRTLREMSVYDAETDSEPRKYGMSKPWFQQGISAVEPIALVYSEPGEKIKIGMSYGLIGKRLLLIKATKLGVKNPTLYTGEGFIVRENGSVRLTPYVVVRDMWILDENRNELYKRYGISSDRLDLLHKTAWEYLKAAEEQLRRRNYDQALKLAHAAWGYESRAYPDVKNTGNDVVKGVMFYLAILLPFAYFLERLLFAFPNVHKQVAAAFGIFILVFIMLAQVHPAFQITVTPLIILLAFVVLALSVIVITIIVRKFEEQLEMMKRETSKVYKADVGRLSASAAAFSLGVSNMRKRKGRTILTCATLVILTFTVISFTSVKTFIRPNRTHLPALTPPYTGVLIRDQYWRALEEPVLTNIMNDLRETEITTRDGKTYRVRNIIAPRAWYRSSGLGNQSFIQLTRVDTEEEKTYTANMLVGMSPNEPGVTRIDRYLRYGRWFKPGETYVCVLPSGVASYLDIGANDVGKAKVRIYGADFTVVGVLGLGFKDLKDLDGEELTPVDYQIMEQQRARGLQGEQASEGELQKYIHLPPDSVAILPFSVVMNQGGTLQAIAIRMGGVPGDPPDLNPIEKLDAIMAPLMSRIALDFFVGRGRETYLYSSIGMTSFSGMSNLFVPILIAALIVLNTMLGAVYERVREIGIYSAVGLAPTHIAFLFMAESVVYAIIGAVLGYLLGQATAWALVKWNLLVGLTLNYSSTSTVVATVIVMAVVLGSTIYPSVKASRMAVPDIERKWKLPEPEGDEWHFDLPFTVLAEEALGLNIFMRDYFEAHADESASDFYTDQVTFARRRLESDEEEYVISMMVWLAPYDLGVSQTIDLQTTPSGGEEKDIYKIFLHVHRESGEVASWKRVNRRFLNLLRKQLLIWRTLGVDVRAEFHERGRKETEEGIVPQLQPQPADDD